jgi:uncharacterized SAM-binding protein YcdF (DUF218 family)
VTTVVRRSLLVVAVAVAALIVYVGVTFAQVWAASRRDDARPSQAIVVFGAAQYNGRPSKVLAARLDHAADLYHRRIAPVIVVTGGSLPGDRFTEATVSAAYLHGRQVPDQDILREVSGRSTWESMLAASRFLHARNIRRVVLVSDPFHSYRLTTIAHEVGLDARASPTKTSTITGLTELRYMGRETVAVAIGRVVGFRREASVLHRADGVRLRWAPG